VPRSPQGGRRIERSLTSQTPWRSAVPPLPVPQGSGRDTADSGSGQTPAARCALRCASATAGGIVHPAARAARCSGGRGQPRYGTYLEGEQSPWKMKCPASGNGRVALRLGSGATPRRRLSPEVAGARVRQRISAPSPSAREERMRGGPLRRIRAHRSSRLLRFPAPGARERVGFCGRNERRNVKGATAVVTRCGCWRGNLRGV
jgi:hypothetical protein